jgi:prepilin-type N-terminal cleavage/methylation domain-containing protein
MLRWQRRLPSVWHRGAVPAGESPAVRRRSGLTLVEMMVAVMILTIGLLAMVGTSAYVVRQLGGGRAETNAATVVQARMEWMRSLPCASITSSNTVTRGVRESWGPDATVNKVLAVRYRARYAAYGTQKTKEFTVMVPCW